LSQEYRELLIGCGNRRSKDMGATDQKEFKNLTTLDIDENCKPDVLWDLNDLPYPFGDNYFDEIHAYDVLEHFGAQGDYRAFFAQFSEFWRISKHGALFLATVPVWNGMWAFGDPGHTRVLPPGCFHYLAQKQYEQVGTTKMTDYRHLYKADFQIIKIHGFDEDYPLIAVYMIAIKK